MEWQAIVLVMQILMLAVGWFLFQQARGELSARAAETPVLGEVKALQRSIKQLLGDLEQASARASELSERSSEQLIARCAEAETLIESLDARLHELPPVHESSRNGKRKTTAARGLSSSGENAPRAEAEADNVEIAVNEARVSKASVAPAAVLQTRDLRRDNVFALADAGQTSGAIARETGLSEGEIETLLGLRMRRA